MLRAAVIVSVVLMTTCGPFYDSFVFDVYINDYSNDFEGGAFEITVDGELAAPERYPNRTEFASEEQANTEPVLVQTWRDGELVDTCRLFGNACRGACKPERTTASVCIDNDGEIGLNTWDCPCDDGVGDWFCGGDCEDTAP